MSENIKESRWVWISSDDSIQRGQISVLALLEIPLAMAFFWWLSSISPWPWLTLIGLMAAPVLLLRSPESVMAGKKMLREYWENEEEIATAQKWLIGLLSTCLAAGLSYWGTQHILHGQNAWKEFWQGAILGAIVLIFTKIFTSAFFLAFSGIGKNISTLVLIFLLAVTGICIGVGMSISVTVIVGMATGVGVSAFLNINITKYILIWLGMPAFVLGIFVRTVLIRLWATLHYWRLGLVTFPRNWRETVCVIDAHHLPELLPGAGEIDSDFSLESLLEQRARGTAEKKIFTFLYVSTLILIIYLPALLYRWNLKASAWLWGLVALLLSPVLWANDEEMRSKTAYWTTWAIQSGLLSVWVGFIGWLLAAYLPKDVQALFPRWVTVAYGYFPLPTLGMRYGFLVLLAICLLGLLLTAYPIRAAHGKALEGAGDFHKGYSDELKAELRRLAIPVRYWFRMNLVVITFTIWAFALQWALQRWPNQLQHVVWSWLRPWL